MKSSKKCIFSFNPSKNPASSQKSRIPRSHRSKKKVSAYLKHERNTRASAGKDVLYFRGRLKPDYLVLLQNDISAPLQLAQLISGNENCKNRISKIELKKKKKKYSRKNSNFFVQTNKAMNF